MKKLFLSVLRRRGTVVSPKTAVFLLCLLAFAPASFCQDAALSKNQVTALSFAAFAPSFITAELNRWVPGLDLPWELRYGVFPLNSLGFLFNGQWEKGLVLGGTDAAAVTGAWFARLSFPLSSFTGMPASHLSFYTDYELYKSSRMMADPASYRYEWKPVDAAQAALAPFRFDYLADPFVSFFLLGGSRRSLGTQPFHERPLRGAERSLCLAREHIPARGRDSAFHG